MIVPVYIQAEDAYVDNDVRSGFGVHFEESSLHTYTVRAPYSRLPSPDDDITDPGTALLAAVSMK